MHRRIEFLAGAGNGPDQAIGGNLAYPVAALDDIARNVARPLFTLVSSVSRIKICPLVPLKRSTYKG
jgi:hypothetical protein